MRIMSVVGARPNFIKLAPVHRALAQRGDVEHVIVHTGQHYDEGLSGSFFSELALPAPQYNLGVGSGTHGKQTAAILERCEAVCQDLAPDWVLVYGDVNSTVAGALAAVKLGIKVAHVEAGLRSGDRAMPEEHNRIVTDHLADLLLAPSRDAVANLLREGVPADRIRFVGNVMIDALVAALPTARALRAAERRGLTAGSYALVTLHRPSNVDHPQGLVELVGALDTIAGHLPVVFPVHPRARHRLEEQGLAARLARVHLLEPLPYLEMLSLVDSARLVITDSGGLQEETTFLGVPCLTVRANTERPITITQGTNRLVADARALVAAVLNGARRQRPGAAGSPGAPRAIERWDGHAAERIAAVLCANEQFGW
jgi:UDP-N-acetylglucosamine 2-epimerase (non-hydrolysing)